MFTTIEASRMTWYYNNKSKENNKINNIKKKRKKRIIINKITSKWSHGHFEITYRGGIWSNIMPIVIECVVYHAGCRDSGHNSNACKNSPKILENGETILIYDNEKGREWNDICPQAGSHAEKYATK